MQNNNRSEQSESSSGDELPPAPFSVWLRFALLYLLTCVLAGASAVFGGLGLIAFIPMMLIVPTLILIMNVKGTKNTYEKWQNLHGGWKAIIAFLIIASLFVVASPLIFSLSTTSAIAILCTGLAAMTILPAVYLWRVEFAAKPDMGEPLLSKPSEVVAGSISLPNGQRFAPAVQQSTAPTVAMPAPKRVLENDKNFAQTGKGKETLLNKIEETGGARPKAMSISIDSSNVLLKFNPISNLEKCLNGFKQYAPENTSVEKFSHQGSNIIIEVPLAVFQEAAEDGFKKLQEEPRPETSSSAAP